MAFLQSLGKQSNNGAKPDQPAFLAGLGGGLGGAANFTMKAKKFNPQRNNMAKKLMATDKEIDERNRRSTGVWKRKFFDESE